MEANGGGPRGIVRVSAFSRTCVSHNDLMTVPDTGFDPFLLFAYAFSFGFAAHMGVSLGAVVDIGFIQLYSPRCSPPPMVASTYSISGIVFLAPCFGRELHI